MSGAMPDTVVPDVLSSAQSWRLDSRRCYCTLLRSLLEGLCGTGFVRHADLDAEWSGTGVYRLQVRLNRPEGRPLFSLKWEGPL